MVRVQGVLKGAIEYAYGIKIQRRLGEAFEISVPTIIDLATYHKFLVTTQVYNGFGIKRIRKPGYSQKKSVHFSIRCSIFKAG